MQLKLIKIQNFKSYKDTFCEFPNEPLLITGKNYDESGTDSNSAGKSNLITAIRWGTFGSQGLSEGKVQDLIRWGAKSCIVELEYVDPNISIKRIRTASKEDVDITFDGISLSQGTTRTEVDKDFQAKLGVNVPLIDIIYNVLVIQSGKSFFTLTPSEQENFITRFLKLQQIRQLYDLAKKRFDGIENNINLVQMKCPDEVDESIPDRLPFEKKLKQIEDSLLKYKNQAQIEIDIEKLQDQQQNIMGQVRYVEGQIKDERERKQRKDRELIESYSFIKGTDNIKDYVEKIPEITENLQNFQHHKGVTEQEKYSLELEKKGYENTLDSFLVCPECKSNLMLIKHQLKVGNKEELETKIVETDKKIASTEKMIRDLQKNIDQGNQFIKKLQNRIEAEKKIEQLKLDTQVIDKTVEKAEKQLKKLQSELENVKKELVSKMNLLKKDRTDYGGLKQEQQQLKSQIEDIKLKEREAGNRKKLIESSEKQIKELRFDFNKYNKYYEIATKVEKKAINDFVPQLMAAINEVLASLEIEERIMLKTGQRKSRKKEDRFAVDVWNPLTTGDDSITSMGKRERILFAQIIALRSILNNTLNYPFKFLIMDEVMSNVDNTGIGHAIEILKEFNIQSFFVLQRSEDIFDCRRLLVEKKNGISSLQLI